MVDYNDHDVFYDYEVLSNATTNAMIYPGSKKIIIPYSTHVDALQDLIPTLNVTQKDEDAILDYIIEENKSSLDRWEIPVENVTMTPNFMQEILKLDTTIPQNGGTMYGFNSSGYDVPITAYLLDDARKQLLSNVKPDEMIVDSLMVRAFSDFIIDHPARSPWRSVRDRANTTGNFDLFQKFAALMNSDWIIDVQSLNAKMSKTALKRLAAQGGFKIETSKKLKDGASTLDSIDDLAELLAYNVNDDFATLWLFEQKPYQTPFNQRKTLIKRYGGAQFQGKNIKRDSTEAKLIENVISPNGRLKDDAVVSTAYPVVRGYLPESAKTEAMSLEKANEMYKPLAQAARAKNKKATDFKERKDVYMNGFLQQQYDALKQTNPDHMIVKDFFYDTGHPRFAAQDGQIVYAADTYAGFNYYMPTRLDQWAEVYGIQSRIVSSLVEAVNDKKVSDDDWDEHANAIIDSIKEHKPDMLYDWFFYPDGRPRVVAKDKMLMMDLLEFMDHRYEMDPDVYRYYSSYRGQDMGKQDSIANVKDSLPKHLKSGAAVLVSPDSPVYATMSIGGVHGNLIDLYRYKEDLKVATEYNDMRQAVMDFYSEKAEQFDADIYIELVGEKSDKEKATIYSLARLEPEELGAVLARRTKKHGFVLGESQAMQEAGPHAYTTGTYASAKYKQPKKTKDMKYYTTTLYDTDVVHTDISSYYPTLISILKTLQTIDGTDAYNELRVERVRLKESLPHDYATWTAQDHMNEAIQLANKLLLNAASGAADAGYDNNIRVNNKAYRMRISGQLILFALALDIVAIGGIPNSINTDGIYAHNIDVETADALIQKWAKLFGLEADTEQVDLFISKDSNNRIEYYRTAKGEKIVASGGTVRNWEGTTLTGNLSKPPIVDRALTNYLVRYDEPLLAFDDEYVRNYITTFIDEHAQKATTDSSAREDLFNFFQLPLASGESKNRYIVYQDKDGVWHYPSSINRTFFVTPEATEAYETYTARMMIINKTIKKDDEAAVAMATQAGLIEMSDYETDKHVHVGAGKITGISIDQTLVIQNQSTATIDIGLIDYLDIDAYVESVKNQWKNWAV